MASANMGSPQNVALLNQKLYDADPDIRYMSLNDLNNIFTSSSGHLFTTDYHVCAKTVDGFLHTLNDTNGEVQNLTIKCLGAFVLRAHPEILCPLIYKIGNLDIDNNVDSSISALAIRQIVVSLPRPIPSVLRTKPVQDAYSAISRVLIPRLIGYLVIPVDDKSLPDPPKGLLQVDLEKGTDGNNIDILIEVAKCFGPMLQKVEIQALEEITLKLLESNKSGSVMKKKAVTALCALAHYFSDSLLSSVISHIIESFRDPHLTPANHRLLLTILGSMARAVPKQFGPHLVTLAPFVLNAISQDELDDQMQNDEGDRDSQQDEVKEAALIALDGFISSCGDDMQRYYNDAIESALKCLKFDPNYAGDDDDESEEEDEDDGLDLDEDFEEEGVADDEDDVSWKVRRCAARVLQTIVSSRTKDILENATTYDNIARALIDRFKEREESVRLEVITTLALLIRKTADQEPITAPVLSPVPDSQTAVLPSRKRRRRESDISMSDSHKMLRLTGSTSPESLTPPPSGAPASLEKISADVVTGILKMLKGATLPTKQASITMLKDLVVARHGGIQNALQPIFEVLVDNIKSAGSDSRSLVSLTTGAASATTASLAIGSLQLTSEICKTHTSKAVQPFLPNLIPSIVAATASRSTRVACEALKTTEQLLKILTPPRDGSSGQKTPVQVQQLLDSLISILSSKAADSTVRQEAVRVLAVLLGRTSTSKGSKLIPVARRTECFDLLLDTVKNETTRYSAIVAVDAMGQIITDTSGVDATWLGSLCLELGAQLRKSDRSLRGASLQALKTLLADKKGFQTLPKETCQHISGLLMPLLTSDDLHLIGLVLLIYAASVDSNKITSLDGTFNESLVELLKSPTAANVVDQLCQLMQSIGRSGIGQPVMQTLLQDVGINGKASVVGKVIGNLLVSGSQTVGISVDEFLKELKSQKQAERKCLALSILGEVGLLSGSEAPLQPDLFTQYFAAASDKVSLDAAIALGRAAAGVGNVKTYLPVILEKVSSGPEARYLALHAIRETLQYNETPDELVPFGNQLWDTAVSASQADNSKEIGAECVANLAIMEPKTFLPRLQALLSDPAEATRAVAILAFRDVYTASDSTYDKYLRPVTIEIITTIMRDADLENRRSALNTFNAAARNKPGLILPHMGQLLPLVLDQTLEDPSLVREVTMGPFKHRVDDGLECRKSAYETMYSIVEVAPAKIDLSKIYDRVVAGVGDEHNIRSLCNLLVLKFISLAPEEVGRRLDELADKYSVVMAQKLKDNAVRHEIERVEEGKKGVMKLALALMQAFPASPSIRWNEFVEVLKKDHKKMMDDVERETKEGNTRTATT